MSERDELSHLLNELQKQKEDLLGASQQMTLKFSSTEAEVCSDSYQQHNTFYLSPSSVGAGTE